MLSAPALSGQRYAVYGLARTGLSVLRFLQRSDAIVTAWDEAPAAREKAAAELPGLELADLSAMALDGLAGIVVSPGVPLNRHPLAARAREAGVPMLGDMELFQQTRPELPTHKLVTITGTNGKSTTTALLHHLLVAGGKDARLGGNIGLPILDQTPLPEDGIYVLELSSFQIDLCQSFASDIAIWTNLTPDHLDRYDGMEGYYRSKRRLFEMQGEGGHAVIATDDEWTRRAVGEIGVQVHAVSGQDVAAEDQARWLSLQGPHNAQNVAIAVAAARLLGVDEIAIESGLKSFPGLPHRMQIVGERRGVRFVNDSKATNPTSVAPALQAFPGTHWILGGQAKTPELDACIPYLSGVKAAYVIGEAAPMFAELLKPFLPVVMAGTLDEAVKAAAAAARLGETILLSPACASFDQFRDYEARGDAFRTAFEGLGA